MRVPLSWLAEYVELPAGLTPEQAHADLVRVGFEEEDLHGFDVTGPVVVGQVESFEEEPQSNGKTIRWCQVRVAPEGKKAIDGGEAVRGIVCGASNFVVGDKVVVTLPGAVLPGPFEIAARKTYGHVSDGMMASARELGLGDDHNGIIRLGELGFDDKKLEIGSDAAKLLGLDDVAVEINVTPDRGYAFSLRGVAREYSHSTGAKLTDPAKTYAPASNKTTDAGKTSKAGTAFATTFPVTIDDKTPIRDKQGCTVFATRVVRGIDPTKPTPPWMVSRLKLAGIRSISLPVDVSNYVMLELGQPNHFYDLDKLAGEITVRRASKGEKLVTLEETERTLDAEDLVITSGKKAIGLAGVMGGADTEISDSTTNVIIEAACFDPVSVARTVRRHKLPSEAAKRFERGVDPEIAVIAANRAATLLAELAGGEVVDEGSFFSTAEPPIAIDLPKGFVSKLIGYDYSAKEIEQSLTEIGCTVEPGKAGKADKSGAENYNVTPPTWRPDLTDKWTLAEEVARIVGYDKIPAELPTAPPGRGYTVAQQVRRRVANALAAAGLTEVVSYPFFDQATNNLYGSATAGEVAQVHLANALDSENGWMRTSLIPGLIATAARNRSRGFTDLALFETGLVFLPENGKTYAQDKLSVTAKDGHLARPSAKEEAMLHAAIPPQPRYIAGLLTGDATPKQPGTKTGSFDWQDALEAVHEIALGAGVALTVAQGSHQAMHPGRTAQILLNGQPIGYAGELLPELALEAHLPSRVAIFEINLDNVCGAAGNPVVAHELATMPAATQDLSLVVAEKVNAGELEAAIVDGAGDLLESVRLVDVYRGEGIPADYKSLTFALRFRAADRTLTQAEATEAKDAAVANAHKKLGAVIRD